MQIKITKDVYDKLSKDDRLRYIYIKTDPKFKRLILQAREHLGISPKTWKDPANNQNGLHSSELVFVQNEAGKIIPPKNWMENRNNKQLAQKKVLKEVSKFLKNYLILDSKWSTFLEMLICYNIGNFYPNKYSFGGQDDGSIGIWIHSPTTSSDFIKWIKTNWDRIKNISGLETPPHFRNTYKEKAFIPTYESLDDVIKIIKLKRAKRESAKQIAFEIDKKEVNEQEKRINKIYHRIKKQLGKLQEEIKERQKIESSLFSNS